MLKLLKYLTVWKAKQEQDESGAKEITAAERVRAAPAIHKPDESGAKEISPTDVVRAAHEPQDLDPPSVENNRQRKSFWSKQRANWSRRSAGLALWSWFFLGITPYMLWRDISAAKNGEMSFGVMKFTLLFAVVVGVLVFRDWLKPQRLSRVWRVLSITGVALVCSAGAIWFMGTAALEWGSCVSGDCQSGRGTFNYIVGHTYEGEWRNGQPGPHGTLRQANGKKYVGEWRDGMPGGEGTTTWPNGDVYVGEHVAGRAWGTGIKIYADGRAESGRWELGKLVEPE